MKKSSIDGEIRREAIVGGFAFLVVLGLFSFSVFITGDVFLKPVQEIRIGFPDVMGLSVGDDVVVRGMHVGEVKKLELAHDRDVVVVTCYLQEQLRLRTDYKATIVQTTILGGQHLAIEEGTDMKLAAMGGVLEGQVPFDIISDAGAVVNSLRTTLEEGVLEDLKVTMQKTRKLIEELDDPEGGTLAKLIKDDSLYTDLRSIVANLKDLTMELNEGDGTLPMLVRDEDVYKDLKSAIDDMGVVSKRLVEGKGLLGKMLADDDPLYTETRILMQDLRAAVDDIRETAPVLTFTSVFFGVF